MSTDRTTTTTTTTTGAPRDRALTVGQVADELGVTVRTLHHYDGIGLVSPSERSAAGYRLYTEADLQRLTTVVVYRRLGFPLEEIRALLGASGAQLEGHLRRQRAAVVGRLSELHDLVDAIDAAIEKESTGMGISRQEQRELFGDRFADHEQEWSAEAQERWGETDAWKQSRDRTSSYGKEDWVAIKADMDAVNDGLAAALGSGEPATSEAAMDAAEAHRRHIERWFYDVPYAMHRGLGDLYVADERFTQTYEDVAPGLARFTRDAIHANADRHEATGA
ncbi:MerR family transcriptional regulator [Lapillicoccus jejuensis]|uniref:DNA-binding transcriptional MerR regulator n=1 Tax=Lapillicoccus jejuensis TaxID=402171 RepID=A0A542DXP3_9MICO|nr:MerR family transcriptional regulator [Lapillicoccus jejuensis]TQJ07845.1 DNA-binding transcriptional MerR regulator [Lapillicoccus jejuensis]